MKFSALFGLLLLVSSVRAAAPRWETLKLSQSPSKTELARYVRAVRLLANAPTSNTTTTPTEAEASLIPKIQQALSALGPQHVGVLLRECSGAEDAVPGKDVQVYVEGGNGQRELVGYDEVKPLLRTLFTRQAMVRIAGFRDVPPEQRKQIYSMLGQFPELVGVLLLHPWDQEMESHLSAELMKVIDETSWRGSETAWIDYLIRVNSPSAWRALDYVLVESKLSVRIEAYEAVQRLPSAPVDLPAVVARAWHNARVQKFRPDLYATIAVKFGHVDALVTLAEWAQNGRLSRDQKERYEQLLASFLEPKLGEQTAASNLVLSNKTKIAFDAVTRKYVLK